MAGTLVNRRVFENEELCVMQSLLGKEQKVGLALDTERWEGGSVPSLRTWGPDSGLLVSWPPPSYHVENHICHFHKHRAH